MDLNLERALSSGLNLEAIKLTACKVQDKVNSRNHDLRDPDVGVVCWSSKLGDFSGLPERPWKSVSWEARFGRQ